MMLFSQTIMAQTTGIPYQAVLLDNESMGRELPGWDSDLSHPLRNSKVAIRFSIYHLDVLEFEEIICSS